MKRRWELSIGMASCIFAFCATLQGQIISDGDFNALSVGSEPDCSAPAGAWGWPEQYDGLCETDPGQFSIQQIDPNTADNSLRVDVNGTDIAQYFHLTNLLNETVYEVPDLLIFVSFDVLVPDEGIGGGAVYLAGGGYDSFYSRGPQLFWNAQGVLEGVSGDEFGLPVRTPLLPGYPVGQWQSLRIVIDLSADNFDVFWARRGEPLALIGEDLKFRSGVQGFVDRVAVVHFGDFEPSSHAYFDNFMVKDNTDTDGDGIYDADDACPASNLSKTVVLGTCDSGVTNDLMLDGCTLSDGLDYCYGLSTPRDYVNCVRHTAATWARAGQITRREAGRLVLCALRGSVPQKLQ